MAEDENGVVQDDAAVAAAVAERVPTSYVILRKHDSQPQTWDKVSDALEAPSKDHAIKLFTDALDEDARGGTWKAVSSTAWKGGQVIEMRQTTLTERTPVDD